MPNVASAWMAGFFFSKKVLHLTIVEPASTLVKAEASFTFLSLIRSLCILHFAFNPKYGVFVCRTFSAVSAVCW